MTFIVRQVRIDIPLRSTRAYLFVDAEQEKWDPWWGLLYQFLIGFAPSDIEWNYEPVQDVCVAKPVLTQPQRNEVVAFLRTAPSGQVDAHRTLQRAVALTPEEQNAVGLMYFAEPLRNSGDPTRDEPRK